MNSCKFFRNCSEDSLLIIIKLMLCAFIWIIVVLVKISLLYQTTMAAVATRRPKNYYPDEGTYWKKVCWNTT